MTTPGPSRPRSAPPREDIRPFTSDEAPAPASASKAVVDRLTYRLDELAEALGVSRRTIERERSAGRFPKPDLQIGRMPMWHVGTIDAWAKGGRR